MPLHKKMVVFIFNRIVNQVKAGQPYPFFDLRDLGVVMIKTLLRPFCMITTFLRTFSIYHGQSQLPGFSKGVLNVLLSGDLNGEIEIAVRLYGTIEIPEDEGPVLGRNHLQHIYTDRAIEGLLRAYLLQAHFPTGYIRKLLLGAGKHPLGLVCAEDRSTTGQNHGPILASAASGVQDEAMGWAQTQESIENLLMRQGNGPPLFIIDGRVDGILLLFGHTPLFF